MKKLTVAIFSVFVLLSSVQVSSAAEYAIDASHSTLGFAVRHLQVGTTRGAFTDYTGVINYNPEDLSTFSANVTIQAASIDTKVEARDNHLRGEDFFNVEQFPTLKFESTRLEQRGEGWVIIGNLTIKDVTKLVTIPVSILGPVQGMKGGDVIGVQGQTVINRQDFHVSWSKALDNGGLVVDDNVELIIEIEAHKQ